MSSIAATATKWRSLRAMLRDWMMVPPDGLPIPPAHLRRLVSGNENYGRSSFLEMGELCAKRVVGSLKKQHVDINDLDAFLDFGCGCGRTMRCFHNLKGVKLYGTDYNWELVRWCRRNLPFAQFGTNQLDPPLWYPSETFDLVYGFSVFTHLPEALQMAWMAELSRVLKPSGYLVISTLPLARLPETERAGQMVVQNASNPGTNDCLAYHAFEYVKTRLADGFEILEFVAGGVGQDFYLLRKCSGRCAH